MGLLDAHQAPRAGWGECGPVGSGGWTLGEVRPPPAAWAASSKRVTGGLSEGSSRKEQQVLEAWLAGSRIFVLMFPALSPALSHLLRGIGDAPK